MSAGCWKFWIQPILWHAFSEIVLAFLCLHMGMNMLASEVQGWAEPGNNFANWEYEMALEDRDIFKVVCERFADQPMEFVMLQYAKAKRINMEIERQAASDFLEDEPVEEEVIDTTVVEEETAAPRKKWSRRSFKVKPQDSITEDVIYCCLCGEARQNLTVKHLAKHGITVEEYKKLCGFPPDQRLMSNKRLAKSKEIIAHAQQARLEKRQGASDEG